MDERPQGDATLLSTRGHEIESLIDRFEAAWQLGQPPSIGDFQPSEPARRAGVLLALVAIDLEYRWKLANSLDSVPGSLDSTLPPKPTGGLPPRPRVEGYLVQLPEIGPVESPPLELIAAEYRARHRWGDRPAHSDYTARFPPLVEDLAVVLSQVDQDLAAERPSNVSEQSTVMPPPDQTGKAAANGDEAGASTMAGARFRILRKHAKGALGQVSVAMDETLHREVALKEIQEGYAEHPESRARFLLEAEVTGKLEHPGIVPVYDLGKYPDGRPYYAMRFIKGESLKQAIDKFHGKNRRRPHVVSKADFASLEFRQLLNRFLDVCNAIEYAHSRGVIHRDIKPDNIMLGKYGETLVVDWGLAKMIDRNEQHTLIDEETLKPALNDGSTGTQMGRAMGTPQYMSPEQADGRLDAMGPPSDIYSLGATLYTLLTGDAPFASGELWEVLGRVAAGEFPGPRRINHHVPRALEAVCIKAMALKSAQRYASARAMADDVEKWLADEMVAAHRESIVGRMTRWVRKNKGIAGAASAALFATVLSAMISSRTHALQSEEQSRLVVETSLDTFEEICRPLADGEMSNLRLFQPFITQIQDFTAKYLASFQNDLSMRPYTGRVLVLRATVARIRFGDDSAEKDYQTAARIFEDLVAEKLDDADSRFWLAKIQLSQARARLQRGDYLAARVPLDGAKRALDELCGSQQDDTTLSYLAEAEHLLGEFYLQLHAHGNDHQVLLQCDEYFQESKDLRVQLLERTRKAEKLSHQRDLARSLGYLGDLRLRQGRVELARKNYEESLAIRRDIFQRDPDPEQRFQYARGLASFGELERDYGGDLEGALTKLRTALSVQEKLADEFDEVESFHTDLGATLNLLAELHLFAAIDEVDKADLHYEATRRFAERATAIYGRFRDAAGAQQRQASRLSILGLVTSKVLLALAERTVNSTESLHRALDAEKLVRKLLGAAETLNLQELFALALARSLEGDPLKLPAAWSALDESIERGQHAVERIERHRTLGFKALADSPEWADGFDALVNQVRREVVSDESTH